MAFNMDPKKCPMPTQDPNVRNKNFKEVALGYTEEMAINEAKRCIHCKNKPCQTGCPVGIDIPEFIAHVAEGDFEAAYQVINRSSSLPAVCGRVCPQESQCEGKCTRGIKNEPVGIGRLERFVADWHRENVHTAPVVPEWNGHKVAIIGAGPAGLTAAGDLAKLGYKVTVYEALHVAGGVLMYGIPEFRLPKAIVQQEIDGLKKMGVDFECNMVIGKVLTIDELMERVRLRGRVRGLRCRSAPLHGHPRREPEGRVLRQRVPDPLQPDEGLPAHQQDPHPHRQEGRRRGRRQRGHGRCPQRHASGCRDRVHRLPPRHGRAACP